MSIRDAGNGTADLEAIKSADASMERPLTEGFDRRPGVHSSGVSWGAIIGGAFVMAALALIMLALGAGFELSAISPWSNVGASFSTAGTAAILWLIVTQVIASAMGGYLTGRLRIRWPAIHTDEVHFRDTANGFLAWAVSLVIAVSFLATAALSMAGGSGNTGAATPERGGSSLENRASVLTSSWVDRLFRSERPGTAESDSSARAEARVILENDLRRRDVPPADLTYLAQLVVARTGLIQSDAQQRVSETISDARQSEDAARKAAAHVLLWIFLALLIGAFCASYAATIGGRQRDRVSLV
jgi:hypothetical protein